jgi:hypothetical protein
MIFKDVWVRGLEGFDLLLEFYDEVGLRCDLWVIF